MRRSAAARAHPVHVLHHAPRPDWRHTACTPAVMGCALSPQTLQGVCHNGCLSYRALLWRIVSCQSVQRQRALCSPVLSNAGPSLSVFILAASMCTTGLYKGLPRLCRLQPGSVTRVASQSLSVCQFFNVCVVQLMFSAGSWRSSFVTPVSVSALSKTLSVAQQ